MTKATSHAKDTRRNGNESLSDRGRRRAQAKLPLSPARRSPASRPRVYYDLLDLGASPLSTRGCERPSKTARGLHKPERHWNPAEAGRSEGEPREPGRRQGGSPGSRAARALGPPAWLGCPRRPVAGHHVFPGSAAADMQRAARKLAEPASASARGDSSPPKTRFFPMVSEGQSRRCGPAFQRAPRSRNAEGRLCQTPLYAPPKKGVFKTP